MESQQKQERNRDSMAGSLRHVDNSLLENQIPFGMSKNLAKG